MKIPTQVLTNEGKEILKGYIEIGEGEQLVIQIDTEEAPKFLVVTNDNH